jgi:hypothetical protein
LEAEDAAPCRHAGVPPQAVVDRVVHLIRNLGSDEANLRRYGLSTEEYTAALPIAVEAIRGSMSASSGTKREFLEGIFSTMREAGALSAVQTPRYGDDTVYRLTVPDLGDVAVIQKGCPDGRHSSVAWAAPDWAEETYLWWVCNSTRSEPGEHIKAGINRLRQRFFSDAPDTLDGVIFHSSLCGTPGRLCPKTSGGMIVDGEMSPPPCIYIMPDRDVHASEWNWDGRTQRTFPAVLMAAFGVPLASIPAYTGYVGFQRRSGTLRTTITARYGYGKSTTFRS